MEAGKFERFKHCVFIVRGILKQVLNNIKESMVAFCCYRVCEYIFPRDDVIVSEQTDKRNTKICSSTFAGILERV